MPDNEASKPSEATPKGGELTKPAKDAINSYLFKLGAAGLGLLGFGSLASIGVVYGYISWATGHYQKQVSEKYKTVQEERLAQLESEFKAKTGRTVEEASTAATKLNDTVQRARSQVDQLVGETRVRADGMDAVKKSLHELEDAIESTKKLLKGYSAESSQLLSKLPETERAALNALVSDRINMHAEKYTEQLRVAIKGLESRLAEQSLGLELVGFGGCDTRSKEPAEHDLDFRGGSVAARYTFGAERNNIAVEITAKNPADRFIILANARYGGGLAPAIAVAGIEGRSGDKVRFRIASYALNTSYTVDGKRIEDKRDVIVAGGEYSFVIYKLPMR